MTDTPTVDIGKPQVAEVSARQLAVNDLDKGLVQKSAANLRAEFEAEKGARIGDFISGDTQRASEVHDYLFDKALKKETAEERRISHLAHLQLELDNNKTGIDRVHSAYGKKVGKAGIPLSQVFPAWFRYEGMVPSGAEIAKGHQAQTLILEKEALSDVYVEFAERYLKYHKVLEGKELRDGKTREETAVIVAAQEAVLVYFGIPNEHTGGTNRQKYEEKSTRTLQEFKGDKSAACTEIGVLAQELLSFAGVRSMLISGGPLLVADSEGNYDNPNLEGHVFNLAYFGQNKDQPFLFDPANFLVVPSESDPTHLQIQSFLSPLSVEQFDDLRNNRNTEVSSGTETRLYSLT